MANGKSAKDAIVLDSDSEPEVTSHSHKAEDRKGKGKSKATDQDESNVVDTSNNTAEPQKATPAAADATPESGPVRPALGISKEERTALEAARHERNRKRRRDQGLPSDDEGGSSSGHASKKTATLSATVTADKNASRHGVEDPMLGNMPSIATQPRTTSNASAVSSSHTSSSTASSAPYKSISPTDRFWHGAIKYSYNALAPPHQAGVKFSELFLPATRSNAAGLQQAILCTYSCEPPFVFSNLPVGRPRSLGGDAPDCLLITDGGRGPDRKPLVVSEDLLYQLQLRTE
jgi:hypothetical protein